MGFMVLEFLNMPFNNIFSDSISKFKKGKINHKICLNFVTFYQEEQLPICQK